MPGAADLPRELRAVGIIGDQRDASPGLAPRSADDGGAEILLVGQIALAADDLAAALFLTASTDRSLAVRPQSLLM
mgnify:CR=1 FL=1